MLESDNCSIQCSWANGPLWEKSEGNTASGKEIEWEAKQNWFFSIEHLCRSSIMAQ